MTDTKFTPGPLKADQHRIYKDNDLIASAWLPGIIKEDRLEGESWLEMRNRTEPQRDARDQESFANALLYAAAPELYEALCGLKNEVSGWLGAFEGELRQIGGNSNFHCIWQKVEKADEALAKARGES